MLLNNGLLKKETQSQVESLGPLAEQVVDRWLSGWRKETLQLEKSGQLLKRVEAQVNKESQALSEARMGGANSHLSDRELMELYGPSMNEGP